MNRKLIKQQRLQNNIILSIYDHSHRVAGDRWLIKIECEAVLPVFDGYFAEVEDEDAELLGTIRKELREALVFSVMKERNFIAEAEAIDARDELVDQVYENMAEYLKRPAFPKKLFVKRFEEVRNSCLLAQRVKYKDEPEDDDSPADFSACFKD